MSIRCSAQYPAQPEHKQLFGLLLFASKHTQANLESPHPPRDSVLRTPSLSPLLGSQAGQQSPQGQLRSPRLPWTLSSDGPSGQGPSSLSNAEGAARPEEQEAAPGRVARMLRNQDSSAATRPSLGSRSRPLPRLCKSPVPALNWGVHQRPETAGPMPQHPLVGTLRPTETRPAALGHAWQEPPPAYTRASQSPAQSTQLLQGSALGSEHTRAHPCAWGCRGGGPGGHLGATAALEVSRRFPSREAEPRRPRARREADPGATWRSELVRLGRSRRDRRGHAERGPGSRGGYIGSPPSGPGQGRFWTQTPTCQHLADAGRPELFCPYLIP